MQDVLAAASPVKLDGEVIEDEATYLEIEVTSFGGGNPDDDKSKLITREEVDSSKKVYRLIKRTEDFVLSLAALLVLAIPMLIVALVVWITSPGASPIFKQERVGKNGKTFKLWKFRSMVPDAESKLEELMPKNEMDGPVFKIKEDPRITPFGSFIRKTSIDELPCVLVIKTKFLATAFSLL
ncbi:MAG: sugar transferase [Oscillospiraceae bacterium]|nr:sugar transferase [Oscillospiraceae bacterium]